VSMPLDYRCHASGREYTEYATNNNPDNTGRIACPVCGKVVKLAAKFRASKRCYTVLPHHNNADFGVTK